MLFVRRPPHFSRSGGLSNYSMEMYDEMLDEQYSTTFWGPPVTRKCAPPEDTAPLECRLSRESVDVAFADVAFQQCENRVSEEKYTHPNANTVRTLLNSNECLFLFENPIFTHLKRHVRKRHVYGLPDYSPGVLPPGVAFQMWEIGFSKRNALI